jgi:histone deacetylase 3
MVRLAIDYVITNLFIGMKHPMKPQRLAATHSLILSYELYKKMDVRLTHNANSQNNTIFQVVTPYRAVARDLCRFHTEDYVNFLSRISPANANQFENSFARYNIGEDW